MSKSGGEWVKNKAPLFEIIKIVNKMYLKWCTPLKFNTESLEKHPLPTSLDFQPNVHHSDYDPQKKMKNIFEITSFFFCVIKNHRTVGAKSNLFNTKFKVQTNLETRKVQISLRDI